MKPVIPLSIWAKENAFGIVIVKKNFYEVYNQSKVGFYYYYYRLLDIVI